MAANFRFTPTGLSRSVTVSGAAPATISLSIQSVGQTVTTAIAGGNLVPRAIRISNNGVADVYCNFGETAAAVSTGVTIGWLARANYDTVMGTGGLPFFAAVCNSTQTVTLIVTPGEGL